MKKIVFLLLIITIHNVYSQNNYYWYKGEKIPLKEVYGKKYLLLEIEKTEDISQMKNILKIPAEEFLEYNRFVISKSVVPFEQKNVREQKWIIVGDSLMIKSSLTRNEQIGYESSFFLMPTGHEVGVSHLFYVKLKKEGDLTILAKTASENNVEILGNNTFMPLWYTLSCSKESDGNALEMANVFYETGRFAAAEPDLIQNVYPFTREEPPCVNDPLFSNQDDTLSSGQWALKNNFGMVIFEENRIDINYCKAKEITTGNSNIITAVIDGGIEKDHPDLNNIYPLSFDAETGTSPSKVYRNHGTLCSGVIGASINNNEGIAGIAPDCPLMDISHSYGSNVTSSQQLSDGINWAWRNGASVINGSWGTTPSTLIDDAIDNALTQGRNGLGCVVIFSAGNIIDSDNTSVAYPANSREEILAVGAIGPCGTRRNDNPNSPDCAIGLPYDVSCYGPELDIMAPGVEIITTDTNSSYLRSAKGTSLSAPMVAAVAGLILSLRPELTQEEVVNIIESTAQKSGGYDYQTTQGRYNGTWHEEMGYGVLDAYAALQLCGVKNFVDQIVITDTVINSCNVNVGYVGIQDSAKLTIHAEQEITINRLFEIEQGSELECSLVVTDPFVPGANYKLTGVSGWGGLLPDSTTYKLQFNTALKKIAIQANANRIIAGYNLLTGNRILLGNMITTRLENETFDYALYEYIIDALGDVTNYEIVDSGIRFLNDTDMVFEFEVWDAIE